MTNSAKINNNDARTPPAIQALAATLAAERVPLSFGLVEGEGKGGRLVDGLEKRGRGVIRNVVGWGWKGVAIGWKGAREGEEEVGERRREERREDEEVESFSRAGETVDEGGRGVAKGDGIVGEGCEGLLVGDGTFRRREGVVVG